MGSILLVGLASGVASAMLTLSVASGSLFSIILFLFSALPILIAAIGWHQLSALVGAITAAVLLYALGDFDLARTYVLSIGLPAWWLGYLALLARAGGPDEPEGTVHWYPVGRLVLWTVAIGAGLVLLSVLLAGSLDAHRAILRDTFETFLRQETNTPTGQAIALPGGGDPDRLIDLVVDILPALVAAMWTAVSLINLWIAGRIVRTSQRLRRPWPDLAEIQLPRFTSLAFIGTVLLSMAPGILGFTGEVVSSSLLIAFAVLGLAFIHFTTRGTRGRPLVLCATYLLLAVQTWTVLCLALLGLAEHAFNLRGRLAKGRPRSPSNPS
jgi:hypothetical protein